jgi:hypothetical protein
VSRDFFPGVQLFFLFSARTHWRTFGAPPSRDITILRQVDNAEISESLRHEPLQRQMLFPVPRSVRAGEPYFQGHIRIGYGLFHYQKQFPASYEIPTKVRSSSTTGSQNQDGRFRDEIGHLCFVSLQLALMQRDLSHEFKLLCVRVRDGGCCGTFEF